MKYVFYTLILVIFNISIVYATPPVVQQVIIPQRVVEFDQNYFQGVNNYFSVGEKLRAEKQEERNAEIEFYKGQIDMLLKILANQNGTKTLPMPTPINPVEPAPTVPPTVLPPNNPDNGEYKITEVDKKVYNIFKASCVKCHGDTQQDGGLSLIKNNVLQLVDIYDRVEIYDRVLGLGLEVRGKARMPKGTNALSDDDVEALRLWMIQESDSNRKK